MKNSNITLPNKEEESTSNINQMNPASLLFLTNMEGENQSSDRKSNNKQNNKEQLDNSTILKNEENKHLDLTVLNSYQNYNRDTMLSNLNKKSNLYNLDPYQQDNISKTFRLMKKFNKEINPNKMDNYNKEVLEYNAHPKYRFYTLSEEKSNLNQIVNKLPEDENPEASSRSKSLIKMIEKERNFQKFKKLEKKLPKILVKVNKLLSD